MDRLIGRTHTLVTRQKSEVVLASKHHMKYIGKNESQTRARLLAGLYETDG